jgi:hypothetical protein
MISKRFITLLLICFSIETFCFSENSILKKDETILDINKQFIDALMSKNPVVRFEGFEAVKKQYKQLVEELIKLASVKFESVPINDPNNSEYIKYYDKYYAIVLLGDIEANKAVPVLLDNLEFKNKYYVFGDSYTDPERLYPSAVALTKIGAYAIRPTIKKLGKYSKNQVGQKICCWILKEVLGAKLAKASIQIAIEETTNVSEKQNLKDTIPILDTYIEEEASSYKP